MKLHSFSRIFSLVAVLALIFALTLAVSVTANAQGSAQGGNELTITHEPINGDCEMVKFSWNKITDAKEYHIYKDGIHIANVPNEDNLTFIFKLPLDVEVVFTVEAISNSGAKLVSENYYCTPAHDHADAVVENLVPATCTVDGSYDSVVYCTVCNEELSREEQVITKLGHNPAAAVEENRVPATCTEDGSYDTVVYCSVCGEELSRDTTVLTKLGHDEIAHDPQDPTCTEIGWNAYVTCSRCSYTTYAENELPALGHKNDVTLDAVAPTCTATGLTEGVKCSRCNEITTAQSELPALGHKNDVTLDAVAPTCTETGLTAGVACSRCGVATTAQEVIPANGHTPAAAVEENRVEATCTVAGSYDSVVYCTVCQAEVSRTTVPVAELGHDTVAHNPQTPTCTEKGWNAYVTCSRCDYTTYAELPANGHTSGATVTENEDPASCSKNGSYDSVVYCTVCGYQISRQNKVVDKLPHTPGSKETENSVEATCTESGRYDTVVYCTVCHAEVSRSSHKVEAFGHSYLADENPEAILVYNYCERCGEKGEFIKAQIPPAHKDTVIKVAGVSACVIVVILCLVALARPATTTPWWRRRR